MMIIFVLVFVLILRARALEMKVIEIGLKSDLNRIHSFLRKFVTHFSINKPVSM